MFIGNDKPNSHFNFTYPKILGKGRVIEVESMFMKAVRSALLGVLICTAAQAQPLVQPIYDAQRAFEQAVAEKGVRPAFLEFLSDDAVIFRPEAVNAREYLSSRKATAPGVLNRRVNFADISSNGLLGYTTGEWTFTPKGKPAEAPRFGHYATVWSRTLNGKYKAILDIEINHEQYQKALGLAASKKKGKGDVNKKGWSVTDATMNFLRMSMSKKGLGSAYDKFAADDVQLLREGLPPIEGRDAAERELDKYMAVEFPTRVSQFETADMAYSWNPCSYADSNEGMERGNCLHVWKLKDQKWRIVLGVFARVTNEIKPILRESDRSVRRRQATR